MPARILLLRGVNVGGAGKLPMAGLRAVLERLGLGQVQTYIQSGNAVFDSELGADKLGPMIRDAIRAEFGFAPETFILDRAGLDGALTDHPFADADPACVHVFFLRDTPKPDDDALRVLAGAGDGWHCGPCRFTLHTPDGFGRSKLAARLDKHLPGPMTARNLRTLAALLRLVDGGP